MGGSDYLLEPLTQRELEVLHLLAEGLSNREIAQRLVLAQGTVKWYNKQIYQKLDVHGREQAVARARQAGLLKSQPEVSEYNLETFKHNLPAQLTSFVGREREIAKVKRLLGTTRLLTLTGPPGTGKTRLGLRVAAEVLDQFADGAYFVELAPISDPALVANTIAQLFGVRETTGQPLLNTLKNYLREKRLFLLLDNFEQVIDAAPLVGELLSASTGVQALVTSREALRVYGEQEYTVPPLAVPDPSHTESLRMMSRYEAVELFCLRAGSVKPDFTLTEENAPFISEICLRLDGLPLAIELAAARSKLLTPESMCARLESRLLALSGGARDLPARMQTLRAAIDWSYDLLDPAEKTLFARLAVFQGGRSVEAVEAVCSHDLAIDVLEGLESLLNKSLLGQDVGLGGETRFVMLELIHEYARERLEESGEAGDIQRRHAAYFLALAERAEAEFHVVRQEYWNARLTDELDNIRTAFNWALDDGAVELGARLVAALRDYWVWNGFLSESSAWIDRALESEGKISPVVRAKTLNTSSRLAFTCGDHASGEYLARQALSLGRDINDKEICAWALLYLSSHLSAFYNKIKEAITHAEESLRLFRDLDHKAGIAHGLNMLGELARLDGDYSRAGQLYEECLILSCETGNREREALSLGNLSYVAYHLGNFNEAVAYSKKALALSNSLQMGYASALCLATIAGPIGAKGDPKLATRLLVASEAQLETMGASIQPGDKLEIDQFKDAIREQLDETEFNKAWVEGRGVSFEEAVAYALGEDIN